MIQIRDDLRVSDYDDLQYAVERRTIPQTGKNAGKELWAVIAFVGKPKNLPAIARRIIAGDAAEQARKSAEVAFDATDMACILAGLPEKAKKR